MEDKTFFQRYPLANYFFLTFLISWGGSSLVAIPKLLQGQPIEFPTDILLMFLWMLAGPFLAGLVMTYLVDGPEGL